ncbi:MAG: diguanylate cyclase, partial [Pseudomonadales bacterium]|nr:diguanylate cyclase [Pseudomonadales bacterium]
MDIQIDPGAPLRSIQRPDANGSQYSRGDYKHQDANVDDSHFNRNNTPDLSETPTENWITLDFQPDLSNRSGVSQFLCFFMAHIIGSTLLFLSFSPQLSLFNLSLWLFIQLLISTPFVASLQRSIKNDQESQSAARSARNNTTLTQENSIGAQLFRPHSANRQSHSSARNPVAFSPLEQVSIAISAVASFSLTVWAVITYLAAPSIEFTLTSTALFFALSITSLWGLRSCNERANQLRLTLYVAPLCLGLLVIWYVAATFDLPLLNNQDLNNSQWLMLYFGFVSLPVSLIIHHRYTSKINQRTQISPEQQTRIHSYLQRQRQKSRYLAGQLQEESRLRKQLEQQMSANRVQMEQNVAERTRELSETNELLNQQIKLRQNISNALARSQARLSQAVEASKLGLWDWDLATDHLYQSPFHASFDKKEWSSRDFLSQLKQVTHPDDFPHVRDTLLSYINGHQENYSVRYRIFDKQLDTWIWIEDRGNAVLRNDEGKAQRIIGTRCNIHEDYQKEEQLRLTKTVFDQTSEGLFVLDHRFRFVTVNQAFKTMLGYTEDDLLGKHWMHVSQTPQKRKVFKQAQISLAETGNWEVEIFEKRANGEYFPIRIQLNTIREAHGAVAHYAGLVSDLKVHKEADEKLKYLLNYDELTGLANRSLFKDRMHSALTRARSSLSQFALLYIDIDRFKHINDSLGHEKADHILKEYSTRLAGTMNRADSVARLGDDEFAVIVSAKDLSQASLAAQDILSALSKPFNAGEEELFISSSIGITMFPSQGRELSVLMQNAASATRQAKYLGGNNFQ